jgi:uncharacterized protein YneF (UPF0154 family)
MKKIKKYIVSVLVILLCIEFGALFGEFLTYKKYKAASYNLNGRIISELDNLINFSGLASK